MKKVKNLLVYHPSNVDPFRPPRVYTIAKNGDIIVCQECPVTSTGNSFHDITLRYLIGNLRDKGCMLLENENDYRAWSRYMLYQESEDLVEEDEEDDEEDDGDAS